VKRARWTRQLSVETEESRSDASRHRRLSRVRERLVHLTAIAVLSTLFPAVTRAQTEYFNTDRRRPLETEDAYVTERREIELKLTSVRLEHERGGVYNWGLEPEIAFGVLPRTQLELGAPLALREAGPQRRSGLVGVDVSLMHNLNVETETWPALGLRADVLMSVGRFAPARAYPSLTGIATRTYRWARIHVNGQYTVGDELPAASAEDVEWIELSRWAAGVAFDRTFPLRSMLLGGELVARRPLAKGAEVEYGVGSGVRYQSSPSLALDGGIGYRLNGPARGWYITLGSAYALGLAH
jgi:hypothetical protein